MVYLSEVKKWWPCRVVNLNFMVSIFRSFEIESTSADTYCKKNIAIPEWYNKWICVLRLRYPLKTFKWVQLHDLKRFNETDIDSVEFKRGEKSVGVGDEAHLPEFYISAFYTAKRYRKMYVNSRVDCPDTPNETAMEEYGSLVSRLNITAKSGFEKPENLHWNCCSCSEELVIEAGYLWQNANANFICANCTDPWHRGCFVKKHSLKRNVTHIYCGISQAASICLKCTSGGIKLIPDIYCRPCDERRPPSEFVKCTSCSASLHSCETGQVQSRLLFTCNYCSEDVNSNVKITPYIEPSETNRKRKASSDKASSAPPPPKRSSNKSIQKGPAIPPPVSPFDPRRGPPIYVHTPFAPVTRPPNPLGSPTNPLASPSGTPTQEQALRQRNIKFTQQFKAAVIAFCSSLSTSFPRYYFIIDPDSYHRLKQFRDITLRHPKIYDDMPKRLTAISHVRCFQVFHEFTSFVVSLIDRALEFSKCAKDNPVVEMKLRQDADLHWEYATHCRDGELLPAEEVEALMNKAQELKSKANRLKNVLNNIDEIVQRLRAVKVQWEQLLQNLADYDSSVIEEKELSI